MGSLADCIETKGSHLSDFEKERLLEFAARYRKDDGYEPQQANLAAIDKILEELQGEHADIVSQVQKKVPGFGVDVKYAKTADVTTALKTLNKNAKKVGKIKIVKTWKDIPDELRKSAEARLEHPSRFGQVFPEREAVTDEKGVVWFIEDNIKDEEHAKKVWLREQVGRHGLQKLLKRYATGIDSDQFFNEIHKDIKDTKVYKDAAEMFTADTAGMAALEKKHFLTIEIMARHAEKLSDFKRKTVYMKFKKFVNKIMHYFFGVGDAQEATLEISDKEIGMLLDATRNFVMTGEVRAFTEFKHPFKYYKDIAKNVYKVNPSALTWWENHQDYVRSVFGADADIFNVLLAITSPEAKVDDNVAFAVQTYLAMMGVEGAEITSRYPSNTTLKVRALQSGDWATVVGEVRSPKVPEMIQAVLGDPNATVNDRHMREMWFGDVMLTETAVKSPKRLAAMQSVFQMSQHTGSRHQLFRLAVALTNETDRVWHPREVQAALWHDFVSKLNGTPIEEAYDFEFAMHKPRKSLDGMSPVEYLRDQAEHLPIGELHKEINVPPAADVSLLEEKYRTHLKKEGVKPIIKYSKTAVEDLPMGVHYKNTLVKEGDYIEGPTDESQVNIYSRNDVLARMHAHTEKNPYAPLVYFYLGGGPVETSLKKKKAHNVDFESHNIYDAYRDPLKFMDKARARKADDPWSHEINILANLIENTGRYDGFMAGSPYKDGSKWVMMLRRAAVTHMPDIFEIGASDTIGFLETGPKDLDEATATIKGRSLEFYKKVKGVVDSYGPAVHMDGFDASLAQFEGTTEGQLEIGAAIRLRGPLGSIRSLLSEVGIENSQNEIYIMRSTEGTKLESNGVLYIFKVKKDKGTVKDVVEKINSFGMHDFNITVSSKDESIFVKHFVFDSDDPKALRDVDKLIKMRNVLEDKSFRDNMEYPVYSEVLVKENFREQIIKYFGKDAGEKVYRKAQERRLQNVFQGPIISKILSGKTEGPRRPLFSKNVTQRTDRGDVQVDTPEFKNIDWRRIKELGKTTDLREAGYILPAGSLVDLSGKTEGGRPGKRSYDHRELGGDAGMQELMALGYIRMDYRSGSIEIRKEPTADQFSVLREIANHHNGEIFLDLEAGPLGKFFDGGYRYNAANRKLSTPYPKGTKTVKIINDIKTFFAGEEPQRGRRGYREGDVLYAKTYAEGVAQAGTFKNILVKREGSKSKHLIIQISSATIAGNVAQEGVSEAEIYYDNLYEHRDGYDRPADFWEIPEWAARAAYSFPDADHYTVRNVTEANEFLKKAKYESLLISGMDANKRFVKGMLEDYKGKVVMGGYIDQGYFAHLHDFTWAETIEAAAKILGLPFKNGSDYGHFAGTATIPRLELSSGCKHNCAFCTVDAAIKTPEMAQIDQQVEAFKDLKFKLVYLNDKTFGQAKNYKYLSVINKKIKKNNPDFKGFIIQTTAPAMIKIAQDEAWLKESGIAYVELGMESYNNDILEKIKKPHRTKSIDKAVEVLRKNNISFIPNVMVGLAGKTKSGRMWAETKETYQNTKDFLEANKDVISHTNTYVLAIYDGTELEEQLRNDVAEDEDENSINKSWMQDQAMHEDFYKWVLNYGSGILTEKSERVKYAMAGEKSLTADKSALSQAAQRIMAGENAETVRKETGWFLWKDEKWRYEIDDSSATLKRIKGTTWIDNFPINREGSYLLGDVLVHDKLFEAYPSLKDVNLVIRQGDFAQKASLGTDPFGVMTISITAAKSRYSPAVAEWVELLFHEVQHAVQEIEGFAKGGNTREFEAKYMLMVNKLIEQVTNVNKQLSDIKIHGTPKYDELLNNRQTIVNLIQEIEGSEGIGIQEKAYKEYLSLAGETEAREVAKRLRLTAKERNEQQPYKDGIPKELIVRGVKFAKAPAPVWHSQMEKFLSDQKQDSWPVKGLAQSLHMWAGPPREITDGIAKIEKIDKEDRTAEDKAELKRLIIAAKPYKGEFKEPELRWSGLLEHLESKSGKISKGDVLDYLAESNVQVTEVEKGSTSRPTDDEIDVFLNDEMGEGFTRAEAREYLLNDEVRDSDAWTVWDGNEEEYFDNEQDAVNYATEMGIDIYDANSVFRTDDTAESSETKFEQYFEKTGKDYRELLLTLPSREQSPYVLYEKNTGKVISEHPNRDAAFEAYTLIQGKEKFDHEIKPKRETSEYQTPSAHRYGETESDTNRLAHIIFEEREGPGGERVLHIFEIQSDMHQEGRKKGYKGLSETETKRKERLERHSIGEWSSEDTDWYNAVVNDRESRGVPDAPFKKTWPLLVMKRMVRYAAENGFAAVAWDTGEVQAERYDLSKQVDIVKAANNEDGTFDLFFYKDGQHIDSVKQVGLPADKIAGVIDKELADKIISQTERTKDYQGDDLKVGGEGMKRFYDDMLPKVVNKFFGKKVWGRARVGKALSGGDRDASLTNRYVFRDRAVEILKSSGEIYGIRSEQEELITSIEQLTRDETEYGVFDAYILGDKQSPVTAHTLPITPEMQDKAVREGMPLFAKAPAVKSAAFKKWFGNSKVVDAKGEPLVVYHGTDADFEEFNIESSELGAHFGTSEQASFHSEKKRLYPVYLYIKNPVRVKDFGHFSPVAYMDQLRNAGAISENDFDRLNEDDMQGKDPREIDAEVREILLSTGYDGIVYLNRREGIDSLSTVVQEEAEEDSSDKDFKAQHPEAKDSYIVFDATQVKSVFNQGAFDPLDPRILYAKRSMGVSDITDEFFSPERSTIGKMIDKIKGVTVDDLVTQNIDRLNPIKVLGHETYMLHRMQGNIASQMAGFFELGMFEWEGNGLSIVKSEAGGFLTWYAALKEDGPKLEQWMSAKRATELAKPTKAFPNGRENYMTNEMRNEIFKVTWPENSEHAQKLNDQFQEYNNNILDVAVEAGIINEAARKEWQQEYYIPFYRMVNDEVTLTDDLILAAPSKIKRHITSGIKQLKGGESMLGNPMENIIRNWTHLINESMRNQSRRHAFEAAKALGMARRVPKSFLKMTDRKTLSYLKDGETVYFQVSDAELWNAMSEFNHEHLDGMLAQMFGKAKGVLTWGVTMGAAFRVANTIRDSLSTSINSPHFIPIVDSFRGMFKFIRKHPDFVRFAGSGGAFTQGFVRGHDPKAQAKHITGMKDKTNVLKKLYNAWVYLGDMSEMAARVQLYSTMRGKGYSHLESAYEAKDIIDFTMKGAGKTVTTLTNMIPFMNARIQGLYRLGRGAKANPVSFWGKGAMLTIASLALWSIWKDDDRYKDLPDDEKWLYHHIWVGEEHVRIPKGFETGMLFSSAFEEAANIQNGTEEGKHVWDFLGHAFKETLAMDIFHPQLIKPAYEIYTNKNTFTGRQIEGMGLTRLSPGLRASPWTPQALKALGEKTNLSPKKVEHLVRGYLGSIGAGVIMAADMAYMFNVELPDQPSMPVSQYPMIGRFYRGKEEAQRTKYGSRVWEMLDEMGQVNADLNKFRKDRDHEKAFAFQKDKKKELRAYNASKPYKSQLDLVRAQMTSVWTSKSSTAQKDARLKRLTKKRNKLHRQMYAAMKKALK